ncbi:hypothetical protein KR222_009897 [Zaprionus bogoriensis]|nr:hypothetical protein KR222_009897 [Zaprionus bogoriensis]
MSCLWRCLMFSALCATLARAQSTSQSPSPYQEQLPEDRQELKQNSHSIYLGIYKNYKSTYLGNKTTSEYKKRLRDRVSATQLLAEQEQQQQQQQEAEPEPEPEPAVDDALALELRNEAQAEALLEAQTETELMYDDGESAAGKKRRKRKRKTHREEQLQQEQLQQEQEQQQQQWPVRRYQVGPGLNVSLDMSNDIVRVKLDGENLKEIIGARWLSADNSEEGRGKKYDMITKVLPLFILPFLIQSAIVPFLVTKLKLLLVKSILVGKLAIFLLIISAIKNSNKMMQSYEVAPSYWAGEPSRRSELAAAASSAAAYNGYRVEGKPTTWVN